MAAEWTCSLCGTLLLSKGLEGLCPKCVRWIAFDRAPDFLQAQEAGGESAQQELPAAIEAESARFEPEAARERIGNYLLLEEIGQGGFGTVWVAEQERPVRRRVALKLIKPGMDTREVIARSEQERRALAETARAGEDPHSKAWLCISRGMADYRACRWEAAAANLEKTADPSWLSRTSLQHVLLAMTCQHQNRFAEARARLELARTAVAAGWPPRNLGIWADEFAAWLLLQEAEALIAPRQK